MATEAEEDWEIDFPAIGDPHHEIRALCAQRQWVDVFSNEDYGHLRNRSWASHPKGYYQPAVLALHKSGRVLYRWRCVPKYSNMSGAGARPQARYTWEKMQAQMGASDDVALDARPTLGAEDLSWPRFLLILFAHGWFLRPKAFPLARDTDQERVSPGAMMPRVYGFVALWLFALLILPVGWFGVAVAVYLLAIVPGMIEIHRQFQNEPDSI